MQSYHEITVTLTPPTGGVQTFLSVNGSDPIEVVQELKFYSYDHGWSAGDTIVFDAWSKSAEGRNSDTVSKTVTLEVPDKPDPPVLEVAVKFIAEAPTPSAPEAPV